ncbi:MAG: acyl-CoA dehydrogenase family protein [Halioglobus sp.]|nr:acyl-CoA dehydrogenase family protein [Halioglobus sp.]
MDFSFTEEQLLLRDSVEKFVADHCDVARHRALSRSALGYDAAAWAQFAALGWLALPFDEASGGLGGGAVDTMVMAQALGAGFVREPYLHTVVTCGALLNAAGSVAQKARFVPAIIDGSTQWALAVAERANDFDLHVAHTEAVEGAQGYVLDGRKIAVLNGHCAQHFIVSAKTARGVGLFIVDAEAAGVMVEPFAALDGSRGADVAFRGVALGEDAILGVPGEFAHLDAAIDTSIVAMGAEALGAMQALLDATLGYTKTREQFGQPISQFQVLQHRMADMYMKVEETRSLLLNAAIAVDSDSEERALACAALKVKLAEAGRFVSQQAVQLHGGIGMTDELGVGHYFKRLMLLSTLYGDERYHLNRYLALSDAQAA